MITTILSIIGTVLMIAFIATVSLGNGNGWGFLLPAILTLMLAGLSYDLKHPRKRSIEGLERPKRRKMRATEY